MTTDDPTNPDINEIRFQKHIENAIAAQEAADREGGSKASDRAACFIAYTIAFVISVLILSGGARLVYWMWQQ